MISLSRNQSIKLQWIQLTSFFVSLRLEYLSVICQYNFFCIDYKKVDRVFFSVFIVNFGHEFTVLKNYITANIETLTLSFSFRKIKKIVFSVPRLD